MVYAVHALVHIQNTQKRITQYRHVRKEPFRLNLREKGPQIIRILKLS